MPGSLDKVFPTAEKPMSNGNGSASILKWLLGVAVGALSLVATAWIASAQTESGDQKRLAERVSAIEASSAANERAHEREIAQLRKDLEAFELRLEQRLNQDRDSLRDEIRRLRRGE